MTDTFTRSHRGGDGSPLLLLHGFTDTWRTWELVLPALEREHDVLALTLAGHAGGPPMKGEISDRVLADAIEEAMNDVGWEAAHVAGNSLGGFLALQIAARGRARDVVAFAPAGGWAEGDKAVDESLAFFRSMQALLQAAAPHAEAILASAEGRRRATEFSATNFEHIPVDLLAHQMRGAAACGAALPLIEYAQREGWSLDAERIECPVRIVWGTADRVLVAPGASVRFREEWLPNAEFIELDGIGHCPQLDVPIEAAQLILDFTRD